MLAPPSLPVWKCVFSEIKMLLIAECILLSRNSTGNTSPLWFLHFCWSVRTHQHLIFSKNTFLGLIGKGNVSTWKLEAIGIDEMEKIFNGNMQFMTPQERQEKLKDSWPEHFINFVYLHTKRKTEIPNRVHGRLMYWLCTSYSLPSTWASLIVFKQGPSSLKDWHFNIEN